MGILKKIWNWLSTDVTKGFQKSDEDFMLKGKTKEYNSGGYIGNNVNYVAPEEFYKVKGIRREGTKIKGGVTSPPTTPRPSFAPPPQNPPRDFKREADEHFRQQQARREADDNFLTGAMVGYIIVDSLNDNNSHKAVEETKSSSYSSSYDSGSSSSCSCDSGC